MSNQQVPSADQVDESTQIISEENGVESPIEEAQPVHRVERTLIDRLFRLSVVILTGLLLIGVITTVARSSVYKIHEYERGLHLRGGRFVAQQGPGWHTQIPMVDTVIIVKVNERLGYVERIPAMTNDNVPPGG